MELRQAERTFVEKLRAAASIQTFLVPPKPNAATPSGAAQ